MKDHGMRLFAPTISTNCDGHYETFLKSCLTTEHKYGDWGQPSKTEKDLGECTKCPMYSFSSKTEKKRHIGVFHRRQKDKADKPPNQKCNVCDAAFGSLTSLNRHKKAENHTTRDLKRTSTDTNRQELPSKKSRKTQQRTLQDFMRQTQQKNIRTNPDTDGDDDDLNEECEAEKCLMNDERLDAAIKQCIWLDCVTCSSWFHAYCVELGHLSPSELEGYDYVCAKCL